MVQVFSDNINIDEVPEDMIGDFTKYTKTLVDIIENSEPNLTIGIYGEWGSGKSTLLSLIRNTIINKNKQKNNSFIETIWFNAWKYEREEHFAIIPLLKTIAFTLPQDNTKFRNLKQSLLKASAIISEGLISTLASKYIGEKGIEKFREEFLTNIAEMDKDTIYYDGLSQVKKVMEDIVNDNGRIVVFIDDLDRCSPKTMLEVFESLKVFLGTKGFIYVLGLSQQVLANLLTYSFKDIKLDGEDYINKIIQIPFKIPVWTKDDLKKLMEKLVEKIPLSDKNFKDNLVQKSSLIVNNIERNPRELKRFLNNCIIIYDMFRDNSQIRNDPSTLFLLEIIKLNWHDFYVKLFDNDIRSKILEKLRSGKEPITAHIDIVKRKREEDLTNDEITLRLNDKDLWEVLLSEEKQLLDINDWNIYRRASDFIAKSAFRFYR